MIALKCPNCGADITLDDTRDFGFCTYCGTKVLLDEYKKRVDGVPGVANLLLRAEYFLKKGDIEKAKEYYNRILDIDIYNEQANSYLNKIKKREETIELKRKQEEEAQKKEADKLLYDIDYRYAKEIFNFISLNCNSNSHGIEGILKCSSGEYSNIYSIIPCSKENACKYSPTYVSNSSKRGALDSVGNIQKIYNILSQNLTKSGYKHDILFISCDAYQSNGSSFFGGTKWNKTGQITYDIWIKIWK